MPEYPKLPVKDELRPPRPMTFVIAVNDEKVFEKTFKASPVFWKGHPHEILVKRGFKAAGLAYNDAIKQARNDTIVLLHQDVFLPEGWDRRLDERINILGKTEKKWGVLGCYGVTKDGIAAGHVYSNGLKRELGGLNQHMRVQSLDELLLVIKKSSLLHFDPHMPHFHLYGTDICLEAEKRGLENFAVSNFCVHNSLRILKLPKEFWICAEFIRKKWKKFLPVRSCCLTVYPEKSRMLYLRALHEIKAFIHKDNQMLPRLDLRELKTNTMFRNKREKP